MGEHEVCASVLGLGETGVWKNGHMHMGVAEFEVHYTSNISNILSHYFLS